MDDFSEMLEKVCEKDEKTYLNDLEQRNEKFLVDILSKRHNVMK